MGQTYAKITKEQRLSDLSKTVNDRGGICLSKEYLGNHTKLEWQCKFDHIWSATPANIKSGKWCPSCSGNKKLSLEIAQKLAETMGGKCLSTAYKNSGSNLEWICSEGHEFKASMNNITSKGSWCPTCSSSLYERMCKYFLECLFFKPFKKSRPDWLISSRGTKLELDGFNEELKIAFEYNGIQHYFYNKFFHKNEEDFWRRVCDDELKRKLCLDNGIKLIEIPTVDSLLDFENAKNLILMQCDMYGLLNK
ncbi:MAG TPA: zinc-ribbon domain-containing protein [Nitrososphaeraceae archaeon]|nr:zinc-ribbon domain-containing protein [Nitrososphaeraceae archaeon]